MQCPNCGSHNKVTINQKNYCADCGEPLPHTATPKPTKATHHQPPAAKPHQPKSPHAKPQTTAAKPAPIAQSTGGSQLLDLRSAGGRRHKPAQSIHGVRRQPGSSKTARHQPAATQAAKPPVAVATAPKPAAHRQQRQSLARQTSRSHQISKFSPSLKTAAAAKEEREQAPEPVPLTAHQTYHVNPKVAQADRAAAIAMHHGRYQQPAAAQLAATAPAAASRTKRRRRPWRKVASLFKARPRLATATAVAAVVLVLAGYVTYLNYPNITMRIAASRAGFDASLPRYTPNGYGFSGPVNYSPGQITVRFNSHSDAGFVSVAQRKTDWDSSSLLENYVLKRTDKFLTFQENGLTIYMYNGNNAAWVNRGIFYTIEGNNYLNSEQILKIATSL